VPFTTAYRPLWLGLGALALDLVVALTVTSLLRQRIGHGVWRTLHWTAYACWPIAFVHGLGAGSDARAGWVQVVDLACLAAVLVALGWRLASNMQVDPAPRVAGAITSGVAVVAVLAWAATGPLQPGWARKAGTPASLLKSSAVASTGTGTGHGAPAGDGFAAPFQAQLEGRLSQAGGGANTVVTIDARLHGGPEGRLQIVLEGAALDDGGLALRQGAMSYGPPGDPQRYRGPVTGLNGAVVTASVRRGGGPASTATVQLAIDPASQRVTGSVHVR